MPRKPIASAPVLPARTGRRIGHAPRRAATAGALLLGLLVLLPPAWAAVGREQAATIAQRVAPGRVLAVERALYVDNTIVWRVKVLADGGVVREVVIDAESGRTR